VDIGPALAEARTKAGMTIQDVSDRTRIRGKLISDIERDDYSACGGDFYTRGHIRAIAKAVGADPVPLIEQYDGNAAAAAAPPAVPEAEPSTKPQTAWPRTRDSARAAPRAEPRPAPRPEHPAGWDRGTGGKTAANGKPGADSDPGAGGDPGLGEDSELDGDSGVEAEPAAGGKRGVAGVAGVAGVVGDPGVGDVTANGSPRATGESAVTDDLGVGGESAVSQEPGVRSESEITRELAVGGQLASDSGLWQRPAAQDANGQVRLGVTTDRLRQSAENVRRAGADAYRQSVPRVRQAGADAYRRTVPPARRAGEQAVRRAGPWARRATADLYDRIGRLRTTDRRLSMMIGAAVIVLAGLIILIYVLVSGSSAASGHATPAFRHPTVSRPAPPRRPRPSTAAHSHAPSTRVASPPVGPLRPASVAAFGPGGTGQGDNPQQASLALSGQDGGWHTNWYATADFGNLQSGTGLLLNMGGAVTVTQARIDLGSAAGGALELRAGNQPVLADLLPVARSADTGGTITLALSHPVVARYLLIWFTSLPPDNAGTYQATIYHVNVTGFS
jgi:transcriptional regulator with XRE-family HTH domain